MSPKSAGAAKPTCWGERAPQPIQPVHCLSPLFYLLPFRACPGAGTPKTLPFPSWSRGLWEHLPGCSLRRKASSLPQAPPPPFSGADSRLHPTARPASDLHVIPYQTAHLSTMPAQACAGMGLVFPCAGDAQSLLGSGRGSRVHLRGLLHLPPKTCRVRGSERAQRKRTEKCEMSESRKGRRQSQGLSPVPPLLSPICSGVRLQDSHSQPWEGRSFSSHTGVRSQSTLPQELARMQVLARSWEELCGAQGALTWSLSSRGWQSGGMCGLL